MRDGVIYMLAGDQRAAQLTIAVYALRKRWQGEVHILTHDDAGEDVARRIVSDSRLDVSYRRWHPPLSGRGKGYHQSMKPLMHSLSPFDRTVFFDTDTLVVGDFLDLFPTRDEIRLTRFADWTTQTNKINGRVRGWLQFAADDAKEQLSKAYPALNTGVIGFSKECSGVFNEWEKLSSQNRVFMGDELAMQCIFIKHSHCVLDERWNCSPVYSWERHGLDAEKPDPRVYHFHGMCHARRNKGHGWRVWIPVYEECVEQNIAGIADWTPGRDRQLKKFLEETE